MKIDRIVPSSAIIAAHYHKRDLQIALENMRNRNIITEERVSRVNEKKSLMQYSIKELKQYLK